MEKIKTTTEAGAPVRVLKNEKRARAAVAWYAAYAENIEQDRDRARWRRYAREARALFRDIQAAGLPASVDIRVDWKRSRTWGNCPRVDLTCWDDSGAVYHCGGYASGCGYDKLSAAIVEALDKCAPVRRALVENWGRALALGRKIQKEIKSGARWVNSEYNGVGTVPACYHGEGLPAFGPVSGCGWSSVRSVLEFLGFRCEVEDRFERHRDWFALSAKKGRRAGKEGR